MITKMNIVFIIAVFVYLIHIRPASFIWYMCKRADQDQMPQTRHLIRVSTIGLMSIIFKFEKKDIYHTPALKWNELVQLIKVEKIISTNTG